MDMFNTVLAAIPKTRSQLVNELDLPEDVTVAPYVWTEVDGTIDSGSPSASNDLEETSSDSSLALSRAMTDSEIDYGRYRRYKSRSFSDPWVHMRTALGAFSPAYLDSLNSFEGTSSESTEESYLERHHYNEELRLKMERFFEDCRVFSPDDPGLVALEDALRQSDTEDSDSDSEIL